MSGPTRAVDFYYDLCELIRNSGEWSDETFGDSWSDGAKAGVPSLLHLREEVDELIASPGDLEEWADVFLLFLDASRRRRISIHDILEAARVKHEINKSRNWGEPDENGVVHHLPAEGPTQ